MDIKLSRGFAKRLSRRIDRWSFQVGVLQDEEYRLPVETPFGEEPKLSIYAGEPVRKKSTEKSGFTIGQILMDNMYRLNINLLTEPFQSKDSEIMRFTRAFLQLATGGKVSVKRVENLLQAVVRNPILRKEYGENSTQAADNKGFNRHLIDTAQTFKAIKAKAKRV